MILLLILFFFFLGVVVGTFNKGDNARLIGIVTWFILIFIIPAAFLAYIAWKSESIIPVEELEMKKFKLIMGFEKRAIEKAGTFNYGTDISKEKQNVILDYYNNELIKIHQMEITIIEQMNACISNLYFISNLFPNTLYTSVSTEVSSNGYENLTDFHRIVLDKKEAFFKFYMEKLYFTENADNFAKVVSFIKENENIYFTAAVYPGGSPGIGTHFYLYSRSFLVGLCPLQKSTLRFVG